MRRYYLESERFYLPVQEQMLGPSSCARTVSRRTQTGETYYDAHVPAKISVNRRRYKRACYLTRMSIYPHEML